MIDAGFCIDCPQNLNRLQNILFIVYDKRELITPGIGLINWVMVNVWQSPGWHGMVDGTNRLSNGECVTKPWVTWLTGRVKPHKLTNIFFFFFYLFLTLLQISKIWKDKAVEKGDHPCLHPMKTWSPRLCPLASPEMLPSRWERQFAFVVIIVILNAQVHFSLQECKALTGAGTKWAVKTKL